ncbi:efflux RND transporter periplasmic adaptor subunit [Zavarzinella formosa]|uniref:efflux RND transporter periplasmic adaptor subunit n=1 Tax=Zavarzinella formosa TaxID=360055 RepID=UPI00030CB1AC|nr:efflux RND transporter periplasmic adaptor subunit [Zavarzinella formosa]
MWWSRLQVWAFGWVVIGGVVASQNALAQSPPVEPGVKQGTLRPKGGEPTSPKDSRDVEVEALKKEIEVLRKKIETLSKTGEQPRQERHKIVVTSPLTKDVVIAQQYVAKIHSQRHINVCSLQMGYLEAVHVKEGQAVKKGDVIFKVLPVLYQAKLDAEMAEVKLAQIEFGNTEKLFKQKVVSQQEMELSQAKLAKAQAKAKLAEAELGFTIVRAPFDGIVDRMQQQEGSLVKDGDVLTTLSDNSTMWVYFNVSEARYLEYMTDKEQFKEGLPIELALANGRKFPQTGKLGTIDAKFNNESGTISFRADFPNPDRLLRHGQSGAVLIGQKLNNVIVIPQKATFEIADKRYVYVIGKDDVAHRREIVIRHEVDDIFVIKKGLDATDKIVLDGVRQIREGEKVEYEFRKPEEAATTQKDRADK